MARLLQFRDRAIRLRCADRRVQKGPLDGSRHTSDHGCGYLIGAGVAAYSAYQSGQAQSANAKYQSAVALRNAELNKQNADFARQNAAYAEQQGAARERDAARRARAVIGATEAAAAGNGLDVGQGSPLDLREGNARIGTENIQAANENGRRTAEGFRRQAFSFENKRAATHFRRRATMWPATPRPRRDTSERVPRS